MERAVMLKECRGHRSDAGGHLFHEKEVFLALETFTEGTDVQKTLVPNIYRGFFGIERSNTDVKNTPSHRCEKKHQTDVQKTPSPSQKTFHQRLFEFRSL